MKLADMRENRHAMSRLVRQGVTVRSQAWGYQVGSINIRKVYLPRPRHDLAVRAEGRESPAPGHRRPSSALPRSILPTLPNNSRLSR
jgi:hypothetical protein